MSTSDTVPAKHSRLRWQVVLLSGACLCLSSLVLHTWLNLSSPDLYGDDPYMLAVFLTSSAIVGGAFGRTIFRAAIRERYLLHLIWIGILVFFSSLIVETLLVSIHTLISTRDIAVALFGFAAGIPISLGFYGIYKVPQVAIVIVSLLVIFRLWDKAGEVQKTAPVP